MTAKYHLEGVNINTHSTPDREVIIALAEASREHARALSKMAENLTSASPTYGIKIEDAPENSDHESDEQ